MKLLYGEKLSGAKDEILKNNHVFYIKELNFKKL